MFNYLIRRILYAVPIMIGVLLLTFVLFFASQTPESLAARVLGQTRAPRRRRNGSHAAATTSRCS